MNSIYSNFPPRDIMNSKDYAQRILSEDPQMHEADRNEDMCCCVENIENLAANDEVIHTFKYVVQLPGEIGFDPTVCTAMSNALTFGCYLKEDRGIEYIRNMQNPSMYFEIDIRGKETGRVFMLLDDFEECNRSIAQEVNDKKEPAVMSDHDVKVHAAQLIRNAINDSYLLIDDIEGITIQDAIRVSGAVYDIEQIVDHMLQSFYDV